MHDFSLSQAASSSVRNEKEEQGEGPLPWTVILCPEVTVPQWGSSYPARGPCLGILKLNK